MRTLTVILGLVVATAAPAQAAGPSGWDHPGYDAEDSYYNPGILNAATGAVAAPGTAFAGQQIVTSGHLYAVTGHTLSSFVP